MKNLVLLGFIFCVAAWNPVNSQKIYSVINLGEVNTQEKIDEAFEAANLCGYINPSESYIITFSDGTTVKIKSQEELTDEGIDYNASCIRSENQEEKEGTIWIISSNNKLLKTASSTPVKRKTEAIRQ